MKLEFPFGSCGASKGRTLSQEVKVVSLNFPMVKNSTAVLPHSVTCSGA